MIVKIIATVAVDVLVQIPDFQPGGAVGALSESNSNKESVLIISAARSPVCIVEMRKDFVPDNESKWRLASERLPPTDKLAVTQTGVTADADETLLES